MTSSEARIINETQGWIKDIVIHHNFCPFAAKPFLENRIHYFVSQATNQELLIDDVIDELIFYGTPSLLKLKPLF